MCQRPRDVVRPAPGGAVQAQAGREKRLRPRTWCSGPPETQEGGFRELTCPRGAGRPPGLGPHRPPALASELAGRQLASFWAVRRWIGKGRCERPGSSRTLAAPARAPGGRGGGCAPPAQAPEAGQVGWGLRCLSDSIPARCWPSAPPLSSHTRRPTASPASCGCCLGLCGPETQTARQDTRCRLLTLHLH